MAGLVFFHILVVIPGVPVTGVGVCVCVRACECVCVHACMFIMDLLVLLLWCVHSASGNATILDGKWPTKHTQQRCLTTVQEGFAQWKGLQVFREWQWGGRIRHRH